MRKKDISEIPVIIAEASHVFDRCERKKGILGFLAMPFQKIANSELFFSLQTSVSAKTVIIAVGCLIAVGCIGGAVLTYNNNIIYYDIISQLNSDNSELRQINELNINGKSVESSPIILSSGEKPDLIDVPFYSQKDYPTGCELVSTSMLLAFYGVDMNAEQLISNGYVTAKKVYLNRYGDAWGPDPNMYFVGDPLDDKGYGCYSGTIISALQKILPEESYTVVDLKKSSLEEICEDYIDKGIPVLLWGSINMKPTYVYDINHWVIDEGNKYGTDFHWRSNEHCLVMTGYDNGYYYFNDPLEKESGTKYLKWQVEKRYSELGMMAVAIEKNKGHL